MDSDPRLNETTIVNRSLLSIFVRANSEGGKKHELHIQGKIQGEVKD